VRLIAASSMLALLIPVLTACGPPSYASAAPAAVTAMTKAIQHYNAGTQTNLASTAGACRSAQRDLSSASDLANPPSSGSLQPIGDALAHAYNLAMAGFTECARADPKLDYPLMAKAEGEIDQANAWLARARSLDH